MIDLPLADGLVLLWFIVMSLVYYGCARSRLLVVGKVHPNSVDYYVGKNTGTFFRWGLPFFAASGIVMGICFEASWWTILFLGWCIALSRTRSIKYP